jgi:hypothetical protein
MVGPWWGEARRGQETADCSAVRAAGKGGSERVEQAREYYHPVVRQWTKGWAEYSVGIGSGRYGEQESALERCFSRSATKKKRRQRRAAAIAASPHRRPPQPAASPLASASSADLGLSSLHFLQTPHHPTPPSPNCSRLLPVTVYLLRPLPTTRRLFAYPFRLRPGLVQPQRGEPAPQSDNSALHQITIANAPHCPLPHTMHRRLSRGPMHVHDCCSLQLHARPAC